VVNKEGLSIFRFNKNIIIIKVPIKNGMVQSLNIKFNKRGLIIKPLLKDNIDILIPAKNRGKSTKN
jgi:hypothetical protein